jgi:hypothetical protein
MAANPKRNATDLSGNTYWRKVCLEYDAEGDIIYLGNHIDKDADDSDTSYAVKKFTMDTNKNVIKIETALGSWTDRASLF